MDAERKFESGRDLVVEGSVTSAPSFEPRPPPVVLIHGAMRTRVGMMPTAAAFRRLGLRARTFGYSTRHGSLSAHGARLESFLDEWLGRGHEPVLGLFCHSMGGLVARAYLARPVAREHATHQRLVMLSPPNRGSWLAGRLREHRVFRWSYGDAVKALVPESAEDLPVPPGCCQVLVLGGGANGARGYNRRIPGDNDGVVAVAEMGLPGIDPVVVGGTHSFLQWRPTVIRRAAHFIATGRDDSGVGDESEAQSR